MNGKMRLAVALGAVVALWSGAASAQTYGNWGQRNQPTQSATTPQVPAVRVNVSGGVNPTDTTFVPQQYDANGYLKVAEQLNPLLNYTLQPSVISGVFAPVWDAQSVAGTYQNRDSTDVIDTRGYNRAALLLYPQGVNASASDSLAGIEFAMEVRSHSGSAKDTSTTYRMVQKTVRTSGTTARDSIGSIADVALLTSAFADSLYKTPMPHETVVIVPAVYAAGGASAGSRVWNKGMVIWTGKVGESGTSAMFPFMSWRLRATKEFYNLAAGPTVMPSGTVAAVRIRCDLVMWRE